MQIFCELFADSCADFLREFCRATLRNTTSLTAKSFRRSEIVSKSVSQTVSQTVSNLVSLQFLYSSHSRERLTCLKISLFFRACSFFVAEPSPRFSLSGFRVLRDSFAIRANVFDSYCVCIALVLRLYCVRVMSCYWFLPTHFIPHIVAHITPNFLLVNFWLTLCAFYAFFMHGFLDFIMLCPIFRTTTVGASSS